jgi:hypothetical protein
MFYHKSANKIHLEELILQELKSSNAKNDLLGDLLLFHMYLNVPFSVSYQRFCIHISVSFLPCPSKIISHTTHIGSFTYQELTIDFNMLFFAFCFQNKFIFTISLIIL